MNTQRKKAWFLSRISKLAEPVRGASGERGMSILNVVLSLLVICVVAILMFSIIKKRVAGPDGKNGTPADTKAVASDTSCMQVIRSISQMASMYNSENGNYPSSVGDLLTSNPGLSQQLEDTQLWVQDGAPVLSSSDSGFVVTGYCTSGKKYEYSSDGGELTATDY